MLKQAITNNSKPPLNPSPFKTPAPVSLDNASAYSPLVWTDYFEATESVVVPGTHNTIQVYKGPAQPSTPVVFVLMHGCGLSAMSWALVAAEVARTYNVLAFDFRGHGDSVFEDPSDLAADTLVNDTILLLDVLYGSMPTLPAIILVGHSMGGAIATRVAASGRVKGIVGLAVVDVVEGTALAALGSMQGIIANRPSSFSSPTKAIEWAVSSNTVRNLASARVSIPAQLKQAGDGAWVWITDLARTESYWRGWFTELSQMFLTARVARLLLLAGTDRLDKALTMGQMQGKFQLVVLPSVGHLVQEDDPLATAQALVAFANRNQFGKPLVFPPKPSPVTRPNPQET